VKPRRLPAAVLNNFAVVVAMKFHNRNSGTMARLSVNWQSRAGRALYRSQGQKFYWNARKQQESNFDRVSYTNLIENCPSRGGESARG